MVLKQRDIYSKNIRVVSLMAGLKMKGIVKWRGLKLQGLLYYVWKMPFCPNACVFLMQMTNKWSAQLCTFIWFIEGKKKFIVILLHMYLNMYHMRYYMPDWLKLRFTNVTYKLFRFLGVWLHTTLTQTHSMFTGRIMRGVSSYAPRIILSIITTTWLIMWRISSW